MRGLLLLLAVAACGDGSLVGSDGGSPADGARRDADPGDGGTDAGPGPDAAGDAGSDAATDAGGGPDAGPAVRNPFGIGLVSPGSTMDLDLAADLAGPGGHVKLIFAGVTRDTAGPDAEWVRAVSDAYGRDLVPVIRMAPPWEDRRVRHQSDDGEHLRYGALAAAYRRVVEGLRRRDGWPLVIEVHNEPDLCYEWTCDAGSVAGGWLDFTQTAREYASMLRDVADALHAIGDGRVRVINAGLAPGGARRCQCGGDGFDPGITSMDFLRAMADGVPDVFDRIDGFASHSYPASGEGFGFFVPFDAAGPGLHVFERELEVVGRPLPVYMTETGWCVPGSRCPGGAGSRDDVAGWTVQAYRDVWMPDERIVSIMPFMLRDAAWTDFEWVRPDGTPQPVFTEVRALRCETISGRCP